MALDTFVVLTNQYASESDALADYDAVRKLYTDLGVIDTYDAAVITRKPGGKVEIVKRTEVPTRTSAVGGLIVGLAVGAAITLFPAAGIGLVTGMLEGAFGGAVIGAVAGHVSGGMKRSDLKSLGELLDEGTSGLVVVAATDVEARVDAAITRAKKRAKADLKADRDALKREIERAGEQARGAKA